jgi:oxalate decarboxylase/phosphoglucose isomerase-like protein (cupin superfamily)
MTKTTYITRGSVRGQCSHKHRTVSGALKCLERDQSGCHEHGGYSDREVYEVTDGEAKMLYTITDDDCHLVVDPDQD